MESMNATDESLRPRVFISYARADGLAFVDQLEPALRFCGFEPIVDRHELYGGEDWNKRIRDLIAEADSVLLVVTPVFLTSKVCREEFDESVSLGKKLVPVIPPEPIQEPKTGELPDWLTIRNLVYFRPNEGLPNGGFGTGLVKLCETLRTDLNWVRDHTRYGQRAAEWLAGNKDASRLLSGNDVALAKAWLAAERRPGSPVVVKRVREFIVASERVELERQDVERKRVREREEDLKKLEDALAKQEKAQKDRDQAQAQREVAQAKAQRNLVIGVTLAVALAVFGTFMWSKANSAERRAKNYLLAANKSQKRAKGYADLVGTIGRIILQTGTAKGDGKTADETGGDHIKLGAGDLKLGAGEQKLAMSDRNATADREQKRALMELCDEAIRITKEFTADGPPRETRDKEKFHELYNGAMFAVELYQRYTSNHEPSLTLTVSGGDSPIESSMVRFGRLIDGKESGDAAEWTRRAKAVEQACQDFKQSLSVNVPNQASGKK